MPSVSMRQMLEAGVHFGHQTRFWNPKMAPFIFGERNKIHIINLEKTQPLFAEAASFIKQRGRRRRHGAVRRHQALGARCRSRRKPSAQRHALRQPALAGRHAHQFQDHPRSRSSAWRDLTELATSGALDKRGKKEATQLRREMDKLERSLGGIKDMESLPDALFVIDVGHEHIAIHEAKKLGIPVVAVVDTNCSPGRHRLRDPGQRRRHARHPAVRGRHRRRGARGQVVGAAGGRRRGRVRRARRGGQPRRKTAARGRQRPAAQVRSKAPARRRPPAAAEPRARPKPRRRRGRRRWKPTLDDCESRGRGCRHRRRARGTSGAAGLRGAAHGASGRRRSRRRLARQRLRGRDSIHEHHSRCGQAAARAHRRRHDGVQEGAGGDQAATWTRPPSSCASRASPRPTRRPRASPPKASSCSSVSADGHAAAMVEVNCETDFVAREQDFGAFAAGGRRARARQPAGRPRRRCWRGEARCAARASMSAAARWWRRSARTSACAASRVLSTPGQLGAYAARHAHRRAGGARRAATPRSRTISPCTWRPATRATCRRPRCRPRSWPRSARSSPSRRSGERQAAGDRRQDGRGPAAQVAGRDHAARPALRQGPGPDHREAAEGRQGARSLRFERFEVGAGIEKKQEDFVAEVMAQVKGCGSRSSTDGGTAVPRTKPRHGGVFFMREGERAHDAQPRRATRAASW